MRKIAKSILILLSAVVFGAFCYGLIVIVEARSVTEERFDSFLNSSQNRIAIDELSGEQLDALLRIEDPAFYDHNGFDVSTPGAGLTTITQSLVKRFFFDDFKPGFGKIRQTLIAVFAVDPLVSKEDQLTVFINEFPFRDDVRGLADASSFYFGKSLFELSQDEFLGIVAMFIAPSHFDIKDQPLRNQTRVNKMKAVLKGDYIPLTNGDVYHDQETR
ncbi:MAG: transglycosylase domain-containing protein [Verrucomicrobiota bacterium]